MNLSPMFPVHTHPRRAARELPKGTGIAAKGFCHSKISFGIFPAVKGRIPVTLIEVGIIVDKGEAERW